ncbi:MAG TPA: hypothetical protein VFQ53_16505 [Kofleriaceae bacterium]|nr:hypothetical protein [Kofleriaceae bacterium]
MRFALVACTVACSGSSKPAPVADLDLGTLGGTHAQPDAAVAVAPSAPPTAPTRDASAPPPASRGRDFTADAQVLYRVAACGGPDEGRVAELTGGDPERLAKLVARHCKNLRERMATFRAAYLERHRSWFEAVVPKDIPSTVIYPFGGGDLMSALVVFPDATEITTISLELAGDPRRLRALSPAALESSLAALRVEIGGLLSVGSNTSHNLSSAQRNELPAQVSSFLIALVTAGFEPVDMRYFTLDDGGAIHYLDDAEIDALDTKRSGALKGDWHSPSFSPAFANVEIRYRRPGSDQIRVHRHLGWNLGDDYLATHPQLVRHLAAKGKVAILTKGGSYLLHRASFSTIRSYMLEHLAWMLSDSTGIPPTYAEPAGMVQETYGTYTGAFLEGSRETRQDDSFVALWKRQPRRRLPFRFGYLDATGNAHLVVTRRKPVP